jgi:hypothetical protein
MSSNPPPPEPPEDPGSVGADAQERDPEIGPGTHPDSETDATPDEGTTGGRP